MATTIDERGRILIPKELRDALGLTPGKRVILYEDQGELRVRPQLTPAEAIEALCGAINEETRDPDAEPIDPLDPLDIKRIWEPRV